VMLWYAWNSNAIDERRDVRMAGKYLAAYTKNFLHEWRVGRWQ
jgi:hypothetical protein